MPEVRSLAKGGSGAVPLQANKAGEAATELGRSIDKSTDAAAQNGQILNRYANNDFFDRAQVNQSDNRAVKQLEVAPAAPRSSAARWQAARPRK